MTSYLSYFQSSTCTYVTFPPAPLQYRTLGRSRNCLFASPQTHNSYSSSAHHFSLKQSNRKGTYQQRKGKFPVRQSAMKILMLAGDYVEDYEVMVPYQALGSLGVEVDVVCPNKKKGDKVATAILEFTEFQTYGEVRGHNFELNKSFDEVNLDEYAGLYIPGGRMNEYIRLDKRVLDITRHFFDKGLPVATICHAAQLLCAAGVCKGRKLTCYETLEPDVTACGGTYVHVPLTEAVVDGNLLSAPAWPGHQPLLKHFYSALGIKVSF